MHFMFYTYIQIGMIQNSFLRQLRLKRIRNKISKIRLVNSNYKNKDNSITFLMLRSLHKRPKSTFFDFFSLTEQFSEGHLTQIFFFYHYSSDHKLSFVKSRTKQNQISWCLARRRIEEIRYYLNSSFILLKKHSCFSFDIGYRYSNTGSIFVTK